MSDENNPVKDYLLRKLDEIEKGLDKELKYFEDMAKECREKDKANEDEKRSTGHCYCIRYDNCHIAQLEKERDELKRQLDNCSLTQCSKTNDYKAKLEIAEHIRDEWGSRLDDYKAKFERAHEALVQTRENMENYILVPDKDPYFAVLMQSLINELDRLYPEAKPEPPGQDEMDKLKAENERLTIEARARCELGITRPNDDEAGLIEEHDHKLDARAALTGLLSSNMLQNESSAFVVTVAFNIADEMAAQRKARREK